MCKGTRGGMPKKFQGENSKSATARARKAEAKAVADARKKQEEEDALWQENDKHVLKKEQRRVSHVPLCYGQVRLFFWMLGFVLVIMDDSSSAETQPKQH